MKDSWTRLRYLWCVSVGLLLILSLFGCAKSNGRLHAHTKLQSQFCVQAKLTYRDLEATLQLRRMDTGIYTIDVLKPASLNGMQIHVLPEQIKATYLGIELPLDSEKLLPTSVVSMITNLLDAVASERGTTVENKDDIHLISGQFDHYEYGIVLNAADGALVSICVPQLQFQLEVIQG